MNPKQADRYRDAYHDTLAEIERLTTLVVRAYMAGAKAAWDNELAGYNLPESAAAWLAAQEQAK